MTFFICIGLEKLREGYTCTRQSTCILSVTSEAYFVFFFLVGVCHWDLDHVKLILQPYTRLKTLKTLPYPRLAIFRTVSLLVLGGGGGVCYTHQSTDHILLF